MYVYILAAVVARLPVIDGSGHSRLIRDHCFAIEGEGYGLVAVEVREGCRQVALKTRVCRVAVGVCQRGREPLRIARNAEKPHGGGPLAGILALGYLSEMQGDIGGRSVGSGGEVQRTCRSAQAAFYALYPVSRIARGLDDESELPYLLVHGRRQLIVGVGLDGHFLHGSEEPAGAWLIYVPLPVSGATVAVVPLIVMFSGVLYAARV